MKVLLTGASGMLGRYVVREFGDSEVTTLGRGPENDIVCDLSRQVPTLPPEAFDVVVHCAGSRNPEEAMVVNPEGTRNLLRSLDAAPPPYLVIVSCYEVYKPGTGENVGESDVDWNEAPVGRSKALAEAEAAHWAADRPEVTLTVVRPARMLGSGVSGELARMFSEVVAGRYVSLRGEEGRISLVTALDVARAIRKTYPSGGVFNLSDGSPVTWRELAEAMSANAGKYTRPVTLPKPWARSINKFLGFLPGIRASLDPARLAERDLTLTLDNSKALNQGVDFFNALSVLRREADGYPYEEE